MHSKNGQLKEDYEGANSVHAAACSASARLGGSTLHQTGVNPKFVDLSLQTSEVQETDSASHAAVRHRGGTADVPALGRPRALAIGDMSQRVVVTVSCRRAEPRAALGEDAPM